MFPSEAMPTTTVRKITGAVIVLTICRNASASHFASFAAAGATSPNNAPALMPITTQNHNCVSTPRRRPDETESMPAPLLRDEPCPQRHGQDRGDATRASRPRHRCGRIGRFGRFGRGASGYCAAMGVEVRDVLEGLWLWRQPHPDWRDGADWEPAVSSFAVESRGVALVIDPLAPPPSERAVWERIDALQPTVAIVLKPDHVRDVDLFVRWYGVRALLDLPFEHVLVSHGEPVHSRADFEAALQRRPWSDYDGS